MSVPGIGPIISSAVVAAIGGGDAFTKAATSLPGCGSSGGRCRQETARSWARYRTRQSLPARPAFDPLLKKSGLSRHRMDDPDELIRVHDQIGFLNLVANALEDDLLGFHLAQT
jgi:hypothetical protein